MATGSRIPINPTTHLPSFSSFTQLSHYLRTSVADEDSRHISESMGQMSGPIEGIITGLRRDGLRTSVAPLMVDLLTVLRSHRNLVVNLGLPWRGLYEYAGYLQALNNFRVLIGQWLLDGGPRSAQLLLSAEDFELVAWRTLGEGVLLIDMYEHWARSEVKEQSVLGSLEEPQVARAVHWWKKLRL